MKSKQVVLITGSSFVQLQCTSSSLDPSGARRDCGLHYLFCAPWISRVSSSPSASPAS
jgi:hypothetical protein